MNDDTTNGLTPPAPVPGFLTIRTPTKYLRLNVDHIVEYVPALTGRVGGVEYKTEIFMTSGKVRHALETPEEIDGMVIKARGMMR